MRFSSIFLAATALITPAFSQSVELKEPNTGIVFQAYVDAPSGYTFGVALPANGTATDFIGILGGKGTGWSGVSLGGAMANKLLIVAWPNGQSILSSFRKAPRYAPPSVATGTFTQTPITKGTYVNATHWTYTFLCSKCIQTDGTTFKAADSNPSLGMAFNTAAPAQKADKAAAMNKHTSVAQFKLDVQKAKRAEFAEWAALPKSRAPRRGL